MSQYKYFNAAEIDAAWEAEKRQWAQEFETQAQARAAAKAQARQRGQRNRAALAIDWNQVERKMPVHPASVLV